MSKKIYDDDCLNKLQSMIDRANAELNAILKRSKEWLKIEATYRKLKCELLSISAYKDGLVHDEYNKPLLQEKVIVEDIEYTPCSKRIIVNMVDVPVGTEFIELKVCLVEDDK